MNTKTKLILAGVGGVAIIIAVSSAQEMTRRWQIQQEVNALEQEVQGLRNGITELEYLNQYFKTNDYRERVAREKLNFRAPGEKVVLIPEGDVAGATTSTQQEQLQKKPASIPLRWWNTFFVEPSKRQSS